MRIIILLAALTTILMSAAPGQAAHEYNHFEFTSDAHGTEGFTMLNAGSGTRGTASWACTGNPEAYFLAQSAAQSAVEFSNIQFTTTFPTMEGIQVDVGAYDPDSSLFTGQLIGFYFGSGGSQSAVLSFTVPAGDYLAVKIGDFGNCETLDTSGASLAFTSSSPAYPTPELGALVLAAAGIIGVGGFVAFRRFR